MRCQPAKALISRSMDEPVSEYDRGRLEQHLQSCSDCNTHVTVLARGSELLQAGSQQEPSESFEWKIQLGIQKALRDAATDAYDIAPRPSFWRPLFATAVAMCGLVLVIGLSAQMLNPGTPAEGADQLATGNPDLRGGQKVEIIDPIYVSQRNGQPVSANPLPQESTLERVWQDTGARQAELVQENAYLRQLTQYQSEQIRRLQMIRSPATLSTGADSGSTEAPR